MIDMLNNFELSILERLSMDYPLIKNHIPFLKVESRESTGAGMYINFIYDNYHNEELNINDSTISTNEVIKIDGLKYGLGYEVDITKGKIKFIELFTYGEKWDGNIPDKFIFTK